ncbi:MAG: hypothetical protein J6Y25_04035 [Elusimicrobiaceae bacterium]|nr:hypothetical protein [Elusimicrobiaceae bacterium]
MYGMMGLLLAVFMAALVWLASKNGRKAERLNLLKAELKKQAEEQARAQKIRDCVDRMPSTDVRRRLQQIGRP